ncbi:VIT domain-containing protein [Chondromyces apiculatus]|uniref:Vault protein inter-alpha-trypsin n=1 Tax=Chondromyces apiculatus DSM 436 TaxID=1192034 RepID=A0A017TEK3_9BACT|nr:VIT domain-containing protein [Chondromyces apiculatus]EYF07016.1 Hypothetical protein CAP_1275 [Chondromyces apiculatus DSM 436]
MPSTRACVRSARAVAVMLLVLAAIAVGCSPGERPLLPKTQTWAELRTVRRGVTVQMPDEAPRAPYPRERLVDGEKIHVADEGLAWLRRDGGATLLVRGPADLTLRADGVTLDKGRAFIDTPAGTVERIVTPSGPLQLAHVRASIDVGQVSASGGSPGGKQADATEIYVLAGEVRTQGGGAARATAGERLTLRGKAPDAKAETAAALIWDDWTGGLATTDRAAEPAPYGVGTVGARPPSEQGAPRFPLAIQRLEVRVTIDGDFAVTEVDEIFFNPSSQTVEGVYRFRTPEHATLHRFGVDRDGVTVWGRVKEKQAAAAQYQANVYAGSKEDPALLEWDAPGVYRARLYPIGPGESRRVVVRYAEWLGRTGAKGERRMYVYPMAAEGAEGSLPVIEELVARIDLSRAGAKEIRVGMQGSREQDTLVVRAQDLTPRADLAVELFDEGAASPDGVSARHTVDLPTLPPEERAEAQRRVHGEADYVLVPVRASDVRVPEGGIDLAVVLDASAATDTGSLAIGRAAVAALLAHLGKDDRMALWAGDSALRPVAGGGLASVSPERRQELLSALSSVERGGATDLGAMLAAAAASLDPTRRGAVIYIGDGNPTVGERTLPDLRERLAKLPRPARIFSLGVGDGADMAILQGLARGAFAERVGDASAAARGALRLLEHAERPAWLGVRVDLGPEVERVFPRDLGALVTDEGAVVVGRLSGRKAPSKITLTGVDGETRTMPLKIKATEDQGDLRRRWAEGRLAQLLDEGVGRAALVDLGSRYGIITPVTSLYVPTRNEMTASEQNEFALRRAQEAAKEKPKKNAGWLARSKDDTATASAEAMPSSADNLEGGTGTRAKGEAMEEAPAAQAAPVAVAPPAEPAAPVAAAPSAMASAPTATLAAPSPAPPRPATRGGGAAFMPPGTGSTSSGSAEKAADIPSHPADPLAQPEQKPAPDQANMVAQTFGTLGALDETRADGDTSGGDFSARGNMWGSEIGDGFGSGSGLGLSGVGEGGGGRGEGIGLGSIGGIGHGSSSGRLGGPGGSKAGEVAKQRRSVLDLEVSSNMATRPQIKLTIDGLPHVAIRCSAAATAPLEERAGLWRERLGRVAGSAHAVASVYRRALADCEAPTFRERARLLTLMLDMMPNTTGRVSLWRVMFRDLGAADLLYRGILARVRTPAEMRELHQALGLRTIDPGLLGKALTEAKTPAAKVAKLREFVQVWPDDLALALRLLDALEDAGDDAGARTLGRTLRARPDADARVRTAVGELYLRLAGRTKDEAQRALDEAEARRTFGEIVEFAPDDPAARRHLGDLLRAHGWYEEAARQYETLARLAPDDPSVSLLRAAASQGMGKLEEAVRWTEAGGAAGAPDVAESPALTARALAATYLAWGRLAAQEGGRKDERDLLAARVRRVRAGEGGERVRGTRATLTWAHPDLHPTLWTNALGAPMPAPEGDVTLGIAQAILPERDQLTVEVRLEPDAVEHAARLGAEAVLTVVFNEAEDDEVIARIPVRFTRDGAATRRFTISGRSVQEVTP